MVPFFKSKREFRVTSISAHRGNKVNALCQRLFSLNIRFATADESFVYESSSRIAMRAPKGVRHLLESLSSMLRSVVPLSVHL
jgi:hypothetical protein